jgi:hypothetical protein
MTRARLAARVLSKIDIPDAHSCWLWRGYIDSKGYGRVGMSRGQMPLAHRVVYEILVGPIESETLDHLCRNRACVNPAHLEEVSMNENWRRGESLTAINSRKTHCVRGHEFTSENTYWASTPARASGAVPALR